MAKRLPIWKVKDIVEICRRCQDQKFDMILFIEGKRGLGKSTLGWQIARRVHSHFKPNEDLCYSRKEVIRQLQKNQRGVILADEMINVGFKRDFYESDQKVLIKGLNMFRDSFNIFIGCIPSFQNLDAQLKDLCKIRISVERRGLAVVHTQIKSMFLTDRWDSRNNQKIETKWSLTKNRKPKYGQLTTARAYLRFDDLTERERDIYETLKHEKRNKIYGVESGFIDEDLKTKSFYERLLEKIKRGGMTKEQVIDILECSGKKWENGRNRISMLLKEEGQGKTLMEYLFDPKKEEREEREKRKELIKAFRGQEEKDWGVLG